MRTTDSIMGVDFANPHFPGLGVEAMALSAMFGRVPPDHFLRPQRPGFHALLLFSAGSGSHGLDFQAVPCGPGTVVHVRPGQVQQFQPVDGLEASVVLFQPDFLPPDRPGPDATLLERALPEGWVTLANEDLEGVEDGFASLAREYTRTTGSRSGRLVLQHLLYALLLRLTQRGDTECAGATSTSAYRRIYRRFRRSLEHRFVQSWRVSEYARELGVSEKTLGRACSASAGLSPAKLIEGRLLLEAKRLLVHTGLPASSIAGQLGFDEPTNFAKFFRRLTGATPIGFRTLLATSAGALSVADD